MKKHRSYRFLYHDLGNRLQPATILLDLETQIVSVPAVHMRHPADLENLSHALKSAAKALDGALESGRADPFPSPTFLRTFSPLMEQALRTLASKGGTMDARFFQVRVLNALEARQLVRRILNSHVTVVILDRGRQLIARLDEMK